MRVQRLGRFMTCVACCCSMLSSKMQDLLGSMDGDSLTALCWMKDKVRPLHFTIYVICCLSNWLLPLPGG